MKYIQLIILMTIVIVSPAIVARASLSLSGGVKSVKNNTVQTKFGLSGKITHFNPTKSIIVIDKVIYWLRAGLTHADLKPGQKVMFNVDKSTKEKIGRITRIWMQEKKEQ